MATFTTNYNFALPQVGGDKNAWGQFLNANWISIDTLLKTSTDTANAALPRAGGTMTGFTILNADPTANLHPVTKQYADAADGALSTRVTAAQTRADNAFANAATAQTTADAKVPTNGDATKNGAFTVTGNLTASNGTFNLFTSSVVRASATEIGFYNVSDATKYAKMTLSNGDWTTSGQVYAYGNVTAASDVRLKMDIEQIRDALSIVNRLRGCFYTRIDTGEHQMGVIAQEMQEVIPQVVHRNTDGMLGVSYGNLTAVLIEAVKELSARLDKIEAR